MVTQLSSDGPGVNNSLLISDLIMRLRNKVKSKGSSSPGAETSLILFCANYKKDKLEKIRRKYKTENCIKCVKKVNNKNNKGHSSTPVTKLKSSVTKSLLATQNNQELFYTTLSPISQRHNTLERMKREDRVRKNLLEKSLHAVIAEAKKELRNQEKSLISSEADYIVMSANNNSKISRNQNYDASEDYVEDEVYEDVLFQQNPYENFYEPVNFNIYEPINFKQFS